jgi:predicted component of type VI protein secretion system
MARRQKNSMIHTRNFVKCEINEFNAMMDAINYKNSIDNLKKQAIA